MSLLQQHWAVQWRCRLCFLSQSRSPLLVCSSLEFHAPGFFRTGGCLHCITIGGCLHCITIGGFLRCITIGGCLRCITIGGCLHCITIGGCLRCITIGGCLHCITIGGCLFTAASSPLVAVFSLLPHHYWWLSALLPHHHWWLSPLHCCIVTIPLVLIDFAVRLLVPCSLAVCCAAGVGWICGLAGYAPTFGALVLLFSIALTFQWHLCGLWWYTPTLGEVSGYVLCSTVVFIVLLTSRPCWVRWLPHCPANAELVLQVVVACAGAVVALKIGVVQMLTLGLVPSASVPWHVVMGLLICNAAFAINKVYTPMLLVPPNSTISLQECKSALQCVCGPVFAYHTISAWVFPPSVLVLCGWCLGWLFSLLILKYGAIFAVILGVTHQAFVICICKANHIAQCHKMIGIYL